MSSNGMEGELLRAAAVARAVAARAGRLAGSRSGGSGPRPRTCATSAAKARCSSASRGCCCTACPKRSGAGRPPTPPFGTASSPTPGRARPWKEHEGSEDKAERARTTACWSVSRTTMCRRRAFTICCARGWRRRCPALGRWASCTGTRPTRTRTCSSKRGAWTGASWTFPPAPGANWTRCGTGCTRSIWAGTRASTWPRSRRPRNTSESDRSWNATGGDARRARRGRFPRPRTGSGTGGQRGRWRPMSSRRVTRA